LNQLDPNSPSRLLPATDNRDLVAGLVAEEPWAQRAFVERMTPGVRRVLTRILGNVHDVDDLTQETLLRALSRIIALREADKLRPYVMQIAVFVGREAIRSRHRRRWLRFFAPEEMPEAEASCSTPEGRRAVRALYAALGTLTPDAHVVFTLRHLEGLELKEVARLTDLSLATVKRRLEEAEAHLLVRAPDVLAFVSEIRA